MARKNLLKGFKKPKGLSFEHDESTSDYGKFVASPFETGFGTTVGNTLRRVLLSSIQGYAISAVKITSYDADGVPHNISSEFETIPNVVEDTLEVLNNLKQIRLRLPEDAEQATLLYEFKGPVTVTSDMFARDDQLEILSKPFHILTMMEGGRVEFEVQVDFGRGYVPAEVNERYIEVVGTIPMDAIYSPVIKVKYAIEPCRVGQRNDYDKLILEIWTDGTINPETRSPKPRRSRRITSRIFVNFNENEIGKDDDFDEEDERVRQLLNTPVEELELSVRSSNCLKNANIRTIGELTRKTEDDIAKTRNFGKKSLQEIREKLLEWNLGLGMTDYSHLKNSIKLPKQKEETDEA